jgi:hypothetical protein
MIIPWLKMSSAPGEVPEVIGPHVAPEFHCAEVGDVVLSVQAEMLVGQGRDVALPMPPLHYHG